MTAFSFIYLFIYFFDRVWVQTNALSTGRPREDIRLSPVERLRNEVTPKK